jgi:hypothetical protein
VIERATELERLESLLGDGSFIDRDAAAIRGLLEDLRLLHAIREDAIQRIERRIDSDDSLEGGECDCEWCVEDRAALEAWRIHREEQR